MAIERLSVPEELLDDVIAVIRAGLRSRKIRLRTRKLLETWCDEEEAYLKRLRGEEEGSE